MTTSLVNSAITICPDSVRWLSAIAAPGIPLGTLGILQYVGPTIQFMLGLFVFGQVVSGRVWFGLVLVWSGCVIYVAGAVRAVRR